MRNFLILLILLAVGGYLYTHQKVWLKVFVSAADPSKEPYAVQIQTREFINGPFTKVVEVVSGNRWRVEIAYPSKPQRLVVVGNGSIAVSNIPAMPLSAAARLDARPMMSNVFSVSAQFKKIMSAGSTITEQRDGHACAKIGITFQGMAGQVWFDSTTAYPVCVIASANGQYTEAHFTKIPINFSDPGTEEFFDFSHTEPIFSRYLTP